MKQFCIENLEEEAKNKQFHGIMREVEDQALIYM